MKNGMHSWICTAVLILVGISIALTGSVAAQSIEDVDLDANDLDGSGTAADPYEITNAAELQAMEDDLDGEYRLSANIGTSSSVTVFNPVGNLSQPFTGTLAGDGHTIQNLAITSERGSSYSRGLFGVVANGTIQDITMNNITATGTGGIAGLIGFSKGRTTIQDVSVNANSSGSYNIGAVVGQASGNTTIRDTSASGNISGYNSAIGGVVGNADDDTTIQNVSANVNVTGRVSAGGVVGSTTGNTTFQDVSVNGSVEGSTRVGGLVGSIFSPNTTIRVASASSNIKGSSVVGGLVGINGGGIQNASATGTVSGNNSVGGLVGAHVGVVRDTYAAGEVTANTTDDVGGLVGSLNLPYTNLSGTVNQSYWDTEATNQSISAGNATGLTTTEMQGQAAETNMAEFDFGSTWQTQPDSYPTLITLSSKSGGNEGNTNGHNTTGFVDVDASDLAGGGTAADPYEITNASELQAMEDDLGANYELVSDIDASETAQFNDGAGFDPVGPSFNAKFGGSLDGNNHTITGLTIDRPTENRIGVIGVLDDEGTIRNVSIVDANITGDFYTGGIVGTTDGEVVSSSVTGTVTSSSNNAGGLAGSNDGLLRESSAQVTVTGKNQLGGLVGLSSGTIRKSSATGSVSASGNRAGNRVGGLVATNNNNATVENSYATGAVAGDSKVGSLVGLNVGSIQQTFAVGSVSGTSSVGGLVGTNTASFAETPGIVESSYFDKQTTGQDTSAGSATGLTTVEMQGQASRSNMAGLNFQQTWTTTNGYPSFRMSSDVNNDSGNDGPEASQVQLSNITLTPQSVDPDSQSTHQLSFEAQNVSADGSRDNFDITFSDKVEVISYSALHV